MMLGEVGRLRARGKVGRRDRRRSRRHQMQIAHSSGVAGAAVDNGDYGGGTIGGAVQ